MSAGSRGASPGRERLRPGRSGGRLGRWVAAAPVSCLLLLASLVAPAPAWGQMAASPAVQGAAEKVAPGVDAKDVDQLIQTLQNPQDRERLIRELRALRAAKQAAAPEEKPGLGATLMQSMSEGLAQVGARAVAVVQEAANVGSLWGWVQRQANTPERRGFWIHTLVTVGIVFGAGLLAALLLRWLLLRPRRSVEQRPPRDGLGRVELLALRTLLELVPIVSFAVAAYGALAFVEPPKSIRLVALAVVDAALVARVLLAGARMVLAPVATTLRIPRISDSTAGYLYVWTGRLVHVIVYGYFLAQAAHLLGVSHGGERTIANLVGLLVAAELFVLVLQNRIGVAAWIRGHERGRRGGFFPALRGRLADAWHVLASLYIFSVYVVWALDVHEGFWRIARGTLGTLAAIAIARLLVDLAGRGIHRLFRVSPELKARLPGLEARVDRYEPVARLVLAIAIGIGAALAALEAWGIHAAEALATPVGQEILGRLMKILLISLVAVGAWELLNLFITRELTKADGTSVQQSQRMRTLLPLSRHALAIVIGVLAGMTILSELGVNIGPLLAGAGVLGLAVGFGAQTLVKDVITGGFILFEDAIAVGDVVEVAGYTGLVEAITLRTIRHRDLSGTVHTIPFSSVTVVRNLTKDYSYYLMDIGVAYREDTDQVVEVVCALLEEMRQDPDYRDAILAPLEVLGLNSFGDSAVMVRARIKTVPLEQWRVGREFNRRMKYRFDELDIEIPFPHRTIYFGVTKDGTAPAGHLRIGPEPGEAPEGKGAAERA